MSDIPAPDMSHNGPMSAVDREALADVIWRATERLNPMNEHIADAILASDWLAQVKATARAEALEEAATAIENTPVNSWTLRNAYRSAAHNVRSLKDAQ